MRLDLVRRLKGVGGMRLELVRRLKGARVMGVGLVRILKGVRLVIVGLVWTSARQSTTVLLISISKQRQKAVSRKSGGKQLYWKSHCGIDVSRGHREIFPAHSR